MKLEELDKKSLALLLIAEDEKGEDDIVVVGGVATVIDQVLYLDRGGGTKLFPIPEDTVSRVRAVKAELKEMFFNAEYFIPLTVGNLPEDKDIDIDKYLHTGLIWLDK